MLVTIVGSGKKEKIARIEGTTIFVNSSVIRNTSNNPVDLLISDGLMSYDDELRKAKDAFGMNSSDSFNMRRGKRDSIKKATINNLYIVSDNDLVDIKKRLSTLGITYDFLNIVNRKWISKEILKGYKLDLLMTKKIWCLISHMLYLLIGKSVPSRYKPSTGGIGILLVNSIFDSKIRLDGIGNNKKTAFYPIDSPDLENAEYNNIHEIVDELILRKNRKKIEFI